MTPDALKALAEICGDEAVSSEDFDRVCDAFPWLLSDRDALAARLGQAEEALRGWEARDTEGAEPCSIERGTTRNGDLEVLVSGLTYKQSEAIENFIAALAASSAGERTE